MGPGGDTVLLAWVSLGVRYGFALGSLWFPVSRPCAGGVFDAALRRSHGTFAASRSQFDDAGAVEVHKESDFLNRALADVHLHSSRCVLADNHAG